MDWPQLSILYIMDIQALIVLSCLSLVILINVAGLLSQEVVAIQAPSAFPHPCLNELLNEARMKVVSTFCRDYQAWMKTKALLLFPSVLNTFYGLGIYLGFLLQNCLFISFAHFCLSLCRNFLYIIDINSLLYEAQVSSAVCLFFHLNYVAFILENVLFLK